MTLLFWSRSRRCSIRGDEGDLLRIDRLVRLEQADEAAWWVIDYKLGRSPEELKPYRRQLLRYRDAIRRLQPGDTVCCAFIAGDGRVVEIRLGVKCGRDAVRTVA